MAYKIRVCQGCGDARPWKWWWPPDLCPGCRGTGRQNIDPADLVDSFDELLAMSNLENARSPQPKSERPNERILAKIRAKKRRLGEGGETTHYSESRPSERCRDRGVTMTRRWSGIERE